MKRSLNDDGVIYRELSSSVSKHPKFTTNEYSTKFVIESLGQEKMDNLGAILQGFIDRAYQNSISEYNTKPYVYTVLLFSDTLDTPIKTIVYDRKDDDIFMILEEVEKLSQSGKLISFLNSIINITITAVHLPKGSGKIDIERAVLHFGVNESALLRVRNNDSQYCLFNALEISRLYLDKSQYYQFKKCISDPAELESKALQLIRRISISNNMGSYGLDCLEFVQKYYDQTFPGKYRIVCVKHFNGVQVLWKGPMGREHVLAILLDSDHYHGLKSITKYFKLRKFCVDCEKSYSQDNQHQFRCKARCYFCSKVGFGKCIDQNQVFIECGKCRRGFRNQQCFDNHLKATCKFYHNCPDCNRVYLTKDTHVCGEFMCRTCHCIHNPDRSCYMVPLKEDKNPEPYRICVYDFETSQDCIVKKGVSKHEVCFVHLRWTCTVCDDNFNENCQICGKEREKSWSWYDKEEPLRSFMTFIIKEFPANYQTYCYAHNAGRFDSHFIVAEMYRMNLNPALVMTGLKLFDITLGINKHTSLHFRDSYLIMQSPLASLPKTFGLDVQDKMYFPYLFCKRSNMNAVLDHLPAISDYIPESMKVDRYKQFKKWYDEHRDNTSFNLREALEEYCANDTLILLKAILSMRRILLKITSGYEILPRSMSIAGVAMTVYKKCFLTPNTIAIIPEGGYERCDKASDKALKWLEWISQTQQIEIQHAGNGREFTVGKWKVDGYCSATNTIYEFLGCYFHSHETCTDPDDYSPNGKLNSHNYKESMQRLESIKAMGYQMVVLWECELEMMLKADPKMKLFFHDHETKGSIVPKEAFFGGRTSAHKLYESSTDSKEISYMDITSLYPSVNYDTPYPSGVPTIIYPQNIHVNWTKPEEILHDGLYKVRLLPPKSLFFPVVPVRVADDDPRLLFPLCLKCALASKAECHHKDSERSWTSTISSIELREALAQGYVATHCYRIWKYNKMDILFKDYVKTFIKLKIESSEFPSSVNTDDKKKAWVLEYKHRLGIDIDLTKVSLNPGMRHMAKLLLNSLWGKFGQRNCLMHNAILDTPAEFYAKILDKKVRVSQIIPIDNKMVRVTFEDKLLYIKEHSASNAVVALWTTSAARLRLYEYIKIVLNTPGCQIIYMDTDSLIFSHPRGKCPIPEGEYLGQMTREHPNEEIAEVVCAGPKQYALRLINKKDKSERFVMKIRGITFDKLNENQLSFQKFKDMVLKPDETSNNSYFQYKRIGADKYNNILTKNVTKKYRTVNTKGYVVDNVVYPYGYKL